MAALHVKNIPATHIAGKRELEFLSDVSERDVSWDKHRAWSDSLAAALLECGLQRPAARVRDCATALFFAMHEDAKTGECGIKLKSAPFCHYRHCSICQWRRSLKHKALSMTALPALLEQYPTAKFAMLTLTVKNCGVSDLRETMQAMNKGWKRLVERKSWPALGWLRATEVTCGKDGSAHPHFHVLMMLPASYFSGQSYIATRTWVQLWRDAMRLDYDPVCDIRAVRPKKQQVAEGADSRLSALISAVSEVIKYATKTSDLLAAGPGFLAEYINQVAHLRFVASGGALKGILKDVREDDSEDLIHVGDGDEDAAAGTMLRFDWRIQKKRYARRRL